MVLVRKNEARIVDDDGLLVLYPFSVYGVHELDENVLVSQEYNIIILETDV